MAFSADQQRYDMGITLRVVLSITLPSGISHKPVSSSITNAETHLTFSSYFYTNQSGLNE
jgi:hypothetical protein